MGPLGMVMLLSVLLTTTGLLAQEHPELSTQEPVPTLHVTFDPKKMTLAWDCQENATVLKCLMIDWENEEIGVKPKKKQCHCTFETRPLHQGVVFLLKGNSSQGLFEERLPYGNPGGNRTAAKDFSCALYDKDGMECTWAKGQAAPADIQYFLYIRDSKGETEQECPQYLEHSGTHVGCLVQDLSGLTFWSYFLVNGTSREVGIQFFDSVLSKSQMRRYRPPSNITVNCNHSHCVLQWERPTAQQNVWAGGMVYEVDLQQKDNKDGSSSKPISVSSRVGNKYNFPINPRARYMVRIRTADSRMLHWGPWSKPLEFGPEEQEPSSTYIYVLVVLGTLLGALLIGFLLKRFLVTRMLFPPIPKIKDKLTDNPESNLQDSLDKVTLSTEKADKEEVLTVEEVS